MTNAIIATTPQQMQEASGLTRTWVERKIETAGREVALAQETIDALKRAGVSHTSALRQQRLARARVAFYEKVRAALNAGYYIIPPFAVQHFAIRVDAETLPSEQENDTKRARWLNDQTPDTRSACASSTHSASLRHTAPPIRSSSGRSTIGGRERIR